MGKRYFVSRRKQGPGLFRIVIILSLVLGGIYGLAYFYYQFEGAPPAPEALPAATSSLDAARDLVRAGNLAEAESMIAPLLQEGGAGSAPQALMVQAEIFLASNREDDALKLLKAAYEDHPDSADRPTAAAKYARLLEKRGGFDEAKRIYEELRASAPPSFRADGLLGLARAEERADRVPESKALYVQALEDAAFNSDAWTEAASAVGRINVAAAFSTTQDADTKYYTVESGDSLTSIGIKLNTTQGLLTRANGIDETTVLKLGQKLKCTPKDFRIVIERSTCRLFLLDKDGLFKMYRVGLGMPDHETVLGKYTLGNKQKDPTWFRPGGVSIPAGDPQNELGTRWMPLVPVEENLPTDLGIHGTIAPDTIGQYKSHGCPRMLNAEVEELYDLVVRSTPVEIVDKLPDNFLHAGG